MKLGVLFSGGKDSALATNIALKQQHTISCFISIFSLNKESYMFHVPNIEFTRIQAKAAEIPLIIKKTKGKKEEELEDLKKAILEAKQKFNIEGIVTGAIRSTYQAVRIERICSELGLWCFNPLWLRDQTAVLTEVAKDFDVIITGVSAYPLDKSFLGKQINEITIKKLLDLKEKFKINEAGEGGEIETTVLDAPFFKEKINIVDYLIEYNNYSGVYLIKKTETIKKKHYTSFSSNKKKQIYVKHLDYKVCFFH